MVVELVHVAQGYVQGVQALEIEMVILTGQVERH